MTLIQGQVYVGEVTKVISGKGVIVTLSDDTTEFIHISKISDKYVTDVVGYAHVGDTWKVTPIMNTKFNKLELSHRDSDLRAVDAVLSVDLRHPPKPKVTNRPIVIDSEKKSQSLDEMIESVNRVLADKKKSQKEERNSNRRRRR